MRIIQIIFCLPAKRGRYFIILFPVCIQSVTDSTPCIKTPVNSPYLPLPIDNKGRSDIPRPCIIRCNFHIMDRIIFLIVFFFPDSFNYHLCMIQLPCSHLPPALLRRPAPTALHPRIYVFTYAPIIAGIARIVNYFSRLPCSCSNSSCFSCVCCHLRRASS